MSMKLQIKGPNATSWSTLRTAEGKGFEKDLKYLQAQRSDWQQNCWDFAGYKYRIGTFSNRSGKEVFEDAEATAKHKVK